MITNAAMKNGFTGGLIVDYPNSKKAKKYYLFLLAGYSDEIMAEAKSVIMPKAKTGDSSDEDSDNDDSNGSDDSDDGKRVNVKGKKNKSKGIKKSHKLGVSGSAAGNVSTSKNNQQHFKDRSWIMKKKER